LRPVSVQHLGHLEEALKHEVVGVSGSRAGLWVELHGRHGEIIVAEALRVWSLRLM
jgi:hypothetical protein